MTVFQDRDAEAVITRVAGDAALQSSPVVRERVTVMVLVTADNTMVTLAVLETWCAAVTIVSSSELTITRETTVVSDLPGLIAPQ